MIKTIFSVYFGEISMNFNIKMGLLMPFAPEIVLLNILN